MSELTQSLKILVTRYPGTMAELARRASIDRSTLYKIISGQRTPRQEQLEHLADALELEESQKSALLLQYKQRGRATDPKLKAELHHLLETAFRVDDYAQSVSIVPNELACTLPCPDGFVAGTRTVTDCVSALLAEYLLSSDTRPLQLSPHTNPILDHVLIDRFSVSARSSVPVCQLLNFSQNADVPRDTVSDIAALTRTLQFLFLSKMNYEARVVRSPATAPAPGALFPVYLLLPEKALLMDLTGQWAFVITDKIAVQNLRLGFTRTYLNGTSVLKLTTGSHDFTDSLSMYSQLSSKKTHLCMVRYSPLLNVYLTPGIIQRHISHDPQVQAQLPYLQEKLQQWTRQYPDVYFSEDGLLQFVRTGRIYELPDSLYTPLDIDARREILLALRAAASSDKQTLRLLDTSKLALTPNMSVNAYRGVGVIFCRLCKDIPNIYGREYLMEDSALSNALQNYLEECKTSDRVRSQKYTLDFIDYCLRLL